MPKSRPHYAQPELSLGDEQPFPRGFHYLPRRLDQAAQTALLADVRDVLAKAPLFQQTMPRTGAALSVLMSNAGEYGWVTDREGGYRYQPTHPVTGEKWPAIPQRLLKLWTDLTGETAAPNQSLINYYDDKAKLGLHQDRGDSSLNAPVVSISLGDDATFVGWLHTERPAPPPCASQRRHRLVWRAVAAHFPRRRRHTRGFDVDPKRRGFVRHRTDQRDLAPDRSKWP